jgi:hypothetical protein
VLLGQIKIVIAPKGFDWVSQRADVLAAPVDFIQSSKPVPKGEGRGERGGG